MTLATIKRTTTNYTFRIPYFDTPAWGTAVERNFDIIDAVMFAFTGLGNIVGEWANATGYTVGQRAVDSTDNTLWQCAVAHTSASSGTFAADRASNPTYWDAVTSQASFRGAWTTATNYNTNEFVYDGYRYGVVTQQYTSGADYDTDVAGGKIVTLIDLTAAMALVAGINLPSLAGATAYDSLRVKSDKSGYEFLNANTHTDTSDVTKKLRHVLSGISAGQTRDITWPDTAITIDAFAASYLSAADAGAFRTAIGAAAPLGYTAFDAADVIDEDDMSSNDATKVPTQQSVRAFMPVGQCQLVLDGGSLKLNRYDGRWLMINGTLELVPSSAPSLSASGLTPGTLYYIYAYMNAGTMTLEASTTVHATDATTGVEIKSGDATRTLVGMAYPVTGPAFADTATQRLVRSWFNSGSVASKAVFTTARSTASGTFVELNSEIRIAALLWSGEVWSVKFTGSATSTTTADTSQICDIAFDGTTPEGVGSICVNHNGNEYNNSNAFIEKTGLSEGYHYATMIGFSGSGTATWNAAAGGVPCTLQGRIHG